jgi:ferric iron reductase protein FhuF
MPGTNADSPEYVDLSDYMDGLFHGPAAHLAEHFVIRRNTAGSISCTELTDPGSLKKLLDAYANTRFPGNDLRSVVSFWSQWYFGFLLPPLLLLASAAQSQVPSSLSSLCLTLNKNGRPERFELTDPIVPQAPDGSSAFERLMPLIDDHLAPLVFSLAARSGVSAKVFWMNAAIVLDYTQDVLLNGKGIDLKEITSSPLKPDGQRNPLFSPYRPSGSEATRTRRICCLRYRLDDVARCLDCSLKPASGRDERPLVLGASDEDLE